MSDNLRELLVEIDYRDKASSTLEQVDRRVDSVRDRFVSMGASAENVSGRVTRFGQAANNSANRVNALGNRARSTRQEVISIGDAMRRSSERTTSSIDRIDKKFKLWQLTATGMDRVLRGNGMQVNSLRQRIDVLDRAINNSNRALEQTRRRYGENSREARQYEDHILNLRLRQAELNRELQNFRRNNLVNTLNTIGSGMENVGRKLTTRVTMPIAAGAAASIKTFIDMENAFSGVKKTVKGTPEEIAAVKKGLDNLATTELPVPRKELYGIAEISGQLGIETKNINSFTETIGKIGAITNLSYDEGSASLARFANIMQMPMENIEKLGSTIVHLDGNLATSANEIVGMGMRLAGAGKQVGMTEAQVLGLAGALSSVGIEAEAGGSAMSKVLLEMGMAVDSGGKELGKFAKAAGKSSKEFAKLFKKDAAAATTEFILGLGKMKAEGKNVAGILDDMGFSEIRVRDALLRATEAGKLFKDSFNEATVAWEKNTALNDVFATRTDNTASKLQLMKSQFGKIAEDIGTILIPIVEKFMGVTSKLAEWFNGLSDSQKKTVINLALYAAAIGPALTVTGNLIKKIGGAINVIGQAGGLLAWLMSPAGIAVMAIGGIIVAGALLIANWDKVCAWAQKMKEIVLGVFGAMKEGIGKTVDWISDKIGKVKEFFTGKTIGINLNETSSSRHMSNRRVPKLAKGAKSWGGGTAIVGEAGAELVTGPRFGNLPKGSRVYNADETKEILAGGRRVAGGQNHYVFSPNIEVTLSSGSREEIVSVKREIEKQFVPMLESYFRKLQMKQPAFTE